MLNTALLVCDSFFFFNDTATTEIYTLSLHDALPICALPWADFTSLRSSEFDGGGRSAGSRRCGWSTRKGSRLDRSEEHTSELQSQSNLVCRLLLEKKKTRAPAASDRCSPFPSRARDR